MKFDGGIYYPQHDDDLAWSRDLSAQAKWRERNARKGLCRMCCTPIDAGTLCAQHMEKQRAAGRASYARRRLLLRAGRLAEQADMVAAKAAALLAAGRTRAAAALVIGDIGHAEAATRQAARRLRALRLLGRRDPAALSAKLVG